MKRIALLLCFASMVAFAGENKIGGLVSAGSSVSNASTAVPFVVPLGPLTVVCDAAAYICTDASTCSAVLGVPVVALEKFPTEQGSANGALSIIPTSGAATCLVFTRKGVMGARIGAASSGGGYTPPSGQAVSTYLNNALTLYVNGSVGSDSNACTSPGVSACATIGAALNRAPLTLKAPLTVSVAVYDAGYAAFELPPFILAMPNDGGTPTVNVLGEALVDASGLTGPVTGTAVSGNNTGGPLGNWPTLTTTGGLLAGELRGYILQITAGTGVGSCANAIYDNTSTVITLTGPCSPAATIDATSVYAVRDPIFVKSTTSTLTTIDGGTQTYGILVEGGHTQPRPPFFGAFVQITGIGVDVSNSAGGAVQVVGNGGVNLARTRILNRSTGAVAYGIRNMGGTVRLQQGTAYTAGVSAYITQVNTAALTSSFSSAVFLGGNSGAAGSVVNMDGSNAGAITNSAVRIGSNTAGVDGVSVQGLKNTQLNFDVDCAGANNIAIKSVDSSSSGGDTAVFLSHLGILGGCGTGVKISGPAAIRIGAGMTLSGTPALLFDVSHGGRVWRQGVGETSGYTNYLSLDGNVYANTTDVEGLGGDVFGLASGSSFDSFP